MSKKNERNGEPPIGIEPMTTFISGGPDSKSSRENGGCERSEQVHLNPKTPETRFQNAPPAPQTFSLAQKSRNQHHLPKSAFVLHTEGGTP